MIFGAQAWLSRKRAERRPARLAAAAALLAWLAVALPARAAAAPPPPSLPGAAAGGLAFYILVLVAAVGGGLAAWSLVCLRRLRRGMAAGDRREGRQVQDVLAVLAQAPARYWRVDAQGGQAGSTDLGPWLGLGSAPARLEDLAPAFAPGGFQSLGQKAAALRHEGRAFDLDLDLTDGRVIAVAGRAVAPLSLVLWFTDVSQTRGEAADLLRSAAAAAAEARELRRILDTLPLPVWRRGADLALAWCNAAYAAMVESDRAGVAAQQIELVSGLDPAQARKLAARAREGADGVSETRHVVVAGDRRALRIFEVPLEDGGLVGTAADVTELERSEADLVRHVDAHAEVLQHLATAISIFGPDKRLLLYNRAFARLWRLEESWLAQSPSFAEFLEELRENRRLPEQVDWQAYKQDRLALFTSVIEPYEELMHLPDERTLRLVVTPHPFGGLLVTYEAVTDQLVLQRARNTLIAVQRATLDNLYEGVAVYGGDGRLKLWNPAFAKIWQLDAAFLASEPHISNLVEAQRALFDNGGDWALRKGRVLKVFIKRRARQGRIERPDGSVVDFASVPLPDGAMLFTYLDVTDSMRIERALRDRNEALQAADQLKSEFIANVSYELRTPLNTIIGFAEIIANRYFGELNQRQLEYADGILASSHHLLLLINDILDLASIEAGHMSLERESFDLHATLVAILGLTRERARRQNLTVEYDCPADIGWIEADERRIKQILFNLMSNAMKFTPAGGVITLGARRSADEVTLSVADNGVGIPEAEQSQVFERFSKSSNSGRQPGAGLGLSLVRSFIELHGGVVELSSVPGQGTAVTCHLPLHPALQEEPGQAEARPSLSAS